MDILVLDDLSLSFGQELQLTKLLGGRDGKEHDGHHQKQGLSAAKRILCIPPKPTRVGRTKAGKAPAGCSIGKSREATSREGRLHRLFSLNRGFGSRRARARVGRLEEESR